MSCLPVDSPLPIASFFFGFKLFPKQTNQPKNPITGDGAYLYLCMSMRLALVHMWDLGFKPPFWSPMLPLWLRKQSKTKLKPSFMQK